MLIGGEDSAGCGILAFDKLQLLVELLSRVFFLWISKMRE
jgi:hypothetical protein